MKHKLTIGVSKKSPKGEVAIIVPGDSVKSVTIEESKEDGYGRQ